LWISALLEGKQRRDRVHVLLIIPRSAILWGEICWLLQKLSTTEDLLVLGLTFCSISLP
jgi:hypothetical protein